MSSSVHLGFELGTGKAVKIPVRNMVVAGQTQESGKTTTLEALIDRAGLTAIAFVTKRGERAFAGARTIKPYLRERANDWEYVLAVLEATMKQRLYKHRSLIIEVCQTAETLADVQKAVREKLKAPRMNGFVRSLYVELDAFLQKVVPRLGRIDFDSTLRLRRGVNVIDMSDRELFPDEMQGMVISSALDWVHDQGEKIITSLPEAWKFLPQGRGSPVKRSAIALAREGSVLGNYVWPDSQDIGGIEKELLRSCPVWLLGVQREANEIQRTLANIPEGIAKPAGKDVAKLKLGQFCACWGEHAIKTYVQPAWMDERQARRIALGEISIEDVAKRSGTKARRHEGTEGEPERCVTVSAQHNPPPAALATSNSQLATHTDEDPMSKEDVDRLDKSIKSGFSDLANRLGGLAGLAARVNAETARERAGPAPSHAAENGSADENALYERFKQRLMEEAPALIKLAVTRPEIELTIERPSVNLDTSSHEGKVAEMITLGLFDKPMNGNAAFKWLRYNRAYNSKSARIYEAIGELVKKAVLKKIPEGGYVKTEGAEVRIKKGGK